MLDATDPGRETYRPLGFKDLWRFTRLAQRRMSGQLLPPAGDGGIVVRPMTPADLDAVAAIETAAFGAPRPAVLADLLRRRPAQALVATRAGRLSGFALARDGRLALHLGPVVAETPALALALVARALAGVDESVIIDVPELQVVLTGWLAAAGFVPQRRFTRMSLGGSGFGQPAHLFALAGPELG